MFVTNESRQIYNNNKEAKFHSKKGQAYKKLDWYFSPKEL